MSFSLAILFVIVGVAAGALSTSFGIGGGALSTPAIRVLGVSALSAIGTTLPSVLPGVITGMLHYRGQRLIRYNVVLIVALPGVIAAILGSLFSHSLPGNGHLIMLITALILMMNAFRLAKVPKARIQNTTTSWESSLSPRSADATGELSDAPPVRASLRSSRLRSFESYKHLETADILRVGWIGIIAGLISGMLGLGGGIVLVPIFVHRLGLSLRESTATSLVCVGVLAVPSIIAHAFIGDINWLVSMLLTVGTIPGAYIGARAALRASEKWLRMSAASVLSVIALIYGASELSFFLR